MTMTELGIVKCGVASRAERQSAAGWPSTARRARGAVAVLECVQCIPCNPCEAACPKQAIIIGESITNCPTLIEDLCTGCGACIAKCPGLAIFVINEAHNDTEATVSFPYEYWSLPEPDEMVEALNRYGKQVGMARVLKVLNPTAFAKTAVVTVVVEKSLADEMRNIRRKE